MTRHYPIIECRIPLADVRRGVDWDVFDGSDTISIQRVDCPDDRDGLPTFARDDDAVCYVALAATGLIDVPQGERDQCRRALLSLWETEG